MKAAGFERPGGPEVLKMMEVPEPGAGPGQVRVAVRAAGVQPFDCKVRSGWIPPGVEPRAQTIPGNEFAGVIDQVGPGVSDFALQDEVLGFGRLGAYAEYLVVPADQITAKPADMSWEVAGAFSASAQTAHIAHGELRPAKGETFLVQGAAGGVGTVAVQLAVLAGAVVIGTARAENHDYLSSLGAVPVEYGEGLVDRVRQLAPQGVDLALDCAGGAALESSLALVADRSRILTLVEHGKADELGIRLTPATRSAARLAELVKMYEQGRLRILVRSTYPLAGAADAHREMETGHGRGKIAITLP